MLDFRFEILDYFFKITQFYQIQDYFKNKKDAEKRLLKFIFLNIFLRIGLVPKANVEYFL